MRSITLSLILTIFLASCARSDAVSDADILARITVVFNEMIAENPNSDPLSSKEVKRLVEQLIKEHDYFWVTFHDISFARAKSGFKSGEHFRNYYINSMLSNVMKKNRIYVFFGPSMGSDDTANDHDRTKTRANVGVLYYCLNREQLWELCDTITADESFDWDGDLRINYRDVKMITIKQ